MAIPWPNLIQPPRPEPHNPKTAAGNTSSDDVDVVGFNGGSGDAEGECGGADVDGDTEGNDSERQPHGRLVDRGGYADDNSDDWFGGDGGAITVSPPSTDVELARAVRDVMLMVGSDPTSGPSARALSTSNVLGGVVLGRSPSEMQAAGGDEVCVLSHRMSSAVAAEWRQAEVLWRETHVDTGLEVALSADRLDAAAAVAATVAGSRLVYTHGDVSDVAACPAVHDGGPGAVAAAAAVAIDVISALTRAIVVERYLSSTGSGESNNARSSLELPGRLRYCPAAEIFAIPDDDPRVVGGSLQTKLNYLVHA